MTPGIITFIVIYSLLTIAYCFTAPSGNMKLRAPNKCLLALGFFIFALIMYCTKPSIIPGVTNKLFSFEVIIIISLFMLMLGDIFLLFDFGRGGDFFLAGNVALFTYELAMLEYNGIHANQYWWIFLVTPIVVAIIIFLTSKFIKYFHFGKYRWPMMFYLFSVTLHGMAGLALTIYLGNSIRFLLLGLGALLFMLSDYDITIDRFLCHNNKWTLRLNGTLYFTGLLLIALSLAF